MKKKSVSARVALLLTLGAVAVVGTPASAGTPAGAATCYLNVVTNKTAISTALNPWNGCEGQFRAILYYTFSPNSATTYSTAGLWVYSGQTSTASTSPSRYFAGVSHQRK